MQEQNDLEGMITNLSARINSADANSIVQIHGVLASLLNATGDAKIQGRIQSSMAKAQEKLRSLEAQRDPAHAEKPEEKHSQSYLESLAVYSAQQVVEFTHNVVKFMDGSEAKFFEQLVPEKAYQLLHSRDGRWEAVEVSGAELRYDFSVVALHAMEEKRAPEIAELKRHEYATLGHLSKALENMQAYKREKLSGMSQPSEATEQTAERFSEAQRLVQLLIEMTQYTEQQKGEQHQAMQRDITQLKDNLRSFLKEEIVDKEILQKPDSPKQKGQIIEMEPEIRADQAIAANLPKNEPFIA